MSNPHTAERPDGNPSNPVVTAQQPCIRCAYNLVGLPIVGKCPECGTPVQDSLRGILLAYASPEYLSSITRGLQFILGAIIASILLAFVNFAISFGLVSANASQGTQSAVSLGTSGVSLIITIVSLIGYMAYTIPDPGYSGLERPNSARTIARIAVLIQAGVSLFSFLLPLVLLTGGLGGVSPTILGGLAVLLILASVVSIVSFLVQICAILRYTSWLYSRLPDSVMEQRARRYVWLVPVVAIVGAPLLFLGPLIALVMYYNTLSTLRTRAMVIMNAQTPE
ncbi:MAG: hypothetical protein ACK5XO_06080 [Phycisphaerales bacterium]|jgi:hypothetical protein